MPLQPDGPDKDRLNEVVRGLNAIDPTVNGRAPILPPGLKPRDSGFKCPKCGQPAHQRVVPAPGTILGYKFLTIADEPHMLQPEDHRPSPVSVGCPETTERDAEGNPTKVYVTLHCMSCFNAWQRRKMMEEVRANVPQLVWEGGPNAGTDSKP